MGQRTNVQEVSMLKIAELFLGSSDDRKLNRTVAQNCRILQSFPWLWAINSHWFLSGTLMRVANGEDMSFFLRSKIVDRIGHPGQEIFGVWIHVVKMLNGMPLEFVNAVWDDDKDIASVQPSGGQWCQALSSCIHNNNTHVLHIVIAFRRGRDGLIIYCPKQPATDFNAVLSLLSRRQ